ncbi:MAG: NAD-dependent epimerase/dehydratase family protein [Armatimonadota bacterium]
MNILVTGGAGFIGSHIVDRCLADGHRVAIVDDLSTGLRETVNPDATFYELDIRNAARLREVMLKERPAVVFHQAAQMDVRKSVVDPVFDAECNILGSLNLIRSAVEAGTNKIIYASTGGAIYGDAQRLPTPEDEPPRPLCPYGITKHTVEHYLHLYGVQDGLRHTVLRYGNVYGPRQNPGGVAGGVAFFAGKMRAGAQPTLYGYGKMTRDYVYVDDVVAANMAAIERGDGEILNIATGAETSVQHIFDEIKRQTRYDGQPMLEPARPGEIARSCLCIARAAEVLRWRPQVSLEDGLRKTVAALRQRQGQRSES